MRHVAISVLLLLTARVGMAAPPPAAAAPDLAAVRKAVSYLQGAQNPDGSIGDSRVPLFEAWETAQAGLALARWSPVAGAGVDAKALDAAIAFLRRCENPQGLVEHNRDHGGAYCVETTSVYVELLAARQPGGSPELAHKARLLREAQLPSGRWRIVNRAIPEPLQEFPSVTAMALGALEAAGASPRLRAEAERALVASQEPDGHFGIEWQYYGTPYYAMSAVLHELRGGDAAAATARRRARAYLDRTQQPDGSWYHEPPRGGRGTSRELQTALALLACLHGGAGSDDAAVARGLAWLRAHQAGDGSWSGGYFPAPRSTKREDVYATALALQVLHLARARR